MKVINYDGRQENTAVTALCLDTAVLAKVYDSLGDTPFANRWANQVAQWCITHYTNYKAAPGIAGTTALYESWAIGANKDDAELVYKWLSHLPAESGLQTDYAVDLIRQVASRTKAKQLADTITGCLDRNKPDEATQAIEAWRRSPIGDKTTGVFPLVDDAALDEAFEHIHQEPLVQYAGAFGEFINPELVADSLVCLWAPTGVGKSTLLHDIAVKGVQQDRNVALVSLGDMSQHQTIRRLIPKITRRPLTAATFKIPQSIAYKDKEPIIQFASHSHSGVTKEEAKVAFTTLAGDAGQRLRLLTYSAGSMGTEDLRANLETWADDGWSPDVLVIDYADLLKLPAGAKERRDSICVAWQRLRALSTDFHCLLVTASQSDTGSFNAWKMTKDNFTDSRTKMDSCTAILAMNQTPFEKSLQTARLSIIKIREYERFFAYSSDMIGFAGCTVVGAPVIRSCWI
jgi:hypothetical protein